GQRNGRQNADDRHDDHQLDQGESPLCRAAAIATALIPSSHRQSPLISRQETLLHSLRTMPPLPGFSAPPLSPPVPPTISRPSRKIGSVGMPTPKLTEPTGTPPIALSDVSPSPSRSKNDLPALVPVKASTALM